MSVNTLRKPSSKTLPVAGIIPFSTTDWPGKITVTVFTQGCPLACVYCHNPTLQPLVAGSSSFAQALALARQRAKLIDGIVISGGEPTLSAGLGAAIAAAHDAGFPVGLHTCGYSPAALRRLVADPATTPDWVGLDIKALPEDMEMVTGTPATVGNRCWESLRILDGAGVDLQVRTTVWKGSPLERGLPRLRAMLPGHELVVQYARAADGSPWRPLPRVD